MYTHFTILPMKYVIVTTDYNKAVLKWLRVLPYFLECFCLLKRI